MDKQSKYTQIDAIWNYLTAHPEGLTTLECAYILQITKLNTRISEMITLGYKISKTWEESKTAWGTKKRFIRYKAVA